MKYWLITLLLSTGLMAAELPNPNIPPVSNLINGKLLPMKPTLAKNQTLQLSVAGVNGSNFTLITHRTVRAHGTRAPIHIHPYGGQTCVIKGEMTLFMDGAEPARKVAGECYWMPARVRMSGVNTGKTDAVMFDTFLVPSEDDIWVIVEPDLPFTQHQLNQPYHKH